MSIREQLKEDMKTAMKAKQTERLGVIRMALAKFKEIDITFRAKGDSEAPESELIATISKMIKQRTESVKTYQENNRPDAADKESQEIEFLQAYLPKPLDEAALKTAIDTAITHIQAASANDTGKIVAYLKEHYAGQIDFGKVVPQIRERFNG